MIINGQAASQIDITDRAVQYGDGCFTTAAITDGRIQLWPLHLARLQLAAERLKLPFTRWDELSQQVQILASNSSDQVLKVILSRGSGGRGYGTCGAENAVYVITLHPVPEHYVQWRKQGIKLNLSPVKLACQPLLAGIKHLNRLEQVLIKAAMQAQNDAEDCVVCDTDSMIVETSVANIFWRKGNHWFTPDLSLAGVEGVMRNLVISVLREDKHAVTQVRAKITVLYSADEVVVCNSLMGLVPVSCFQASAEHKAHHFRHVTVNSLQRRLEERIKEINGC